MYSYSRVAKLYTLITSLEKLPCKYRLCLIISKLITLVVIILIYFLSWKIVDQKYVLYTYYGGPQLSRQNQKPHGKNKNLTAKPKTSRQKQNTSRQNQILHSKNKIALVLPWVFAFAVRYSVFAVKYLLLP